MPQSDDVMNAQKARYTWRLSGIDEIGIGTSQVQQAHSEGKILTLPIAPTDVYLLTKEPEDLSLSSLYAHRQLMAHQGTRSLRHELAFWQSYFRPLRCFR